MYERLVRWLSPLMAMMSMQTLAGCAVPNALEEEESEARGKDDLSIGEVEGAVGDVGAATTCKPIPKVDPLKDPEIVISLDGLTLHLRDRAGTYDRVFPIGPGAIEDGKSKTPVGQFYTGSNTTEVKDTQFGYYYPCRMWWTDPDTGKQSPVFAGLPFIRLAGTPTAGYGIHGPIDGFTASNGGSLRRGYVSHGCVRMAAEDVVEVYGRIHAHSRTPVKIQREIERLPSGAAVDLASRWIGAECKSDSDCNYPGGFCRASSSGVGTCTLPCTHGCPDRRGEAPTFCVKDATTGAGMCVPQSSTTFNFSCARYERRLVAATAARPDKTATALVCRP